MNITVAIALLPVLVGCSDDQPMPALPTPICPTDQQIQQATGGHVVLNMDGREFDVPTSDCACQLEDIVLKSEAPTGEIRYWYKINGFRTLSSATGSFDVVVTMKERPWEECNPSGDLCTGACEECGVEKAVASQHCAIADAMALGGQYLFSFSLGNAFYATIDRDIVYSLAARTDVLVVEPRYPGTI